MNFCCDQMEFFSSNSEDALIRYVPYFDEYGLVLHDSGSSYVTIEYCPWCEKKLPESKRDMWFNLLEDQGYLNPLEEEIPNRFKQYGWWKEHHSQDVYDLSAKTQDP